MVQRLLNRVRGAAWCRWFCFLAVGLAVAGRLTAAERPNILWLTSEDHGPQMGCYGDPLARTPHIDRLATRGMIFDRCWSNVPVCAPARTAIITGVYPASSGGLHMRSMVPLPAGWRLFPAYLRERGYYCTNNSKEDYNVPKSPGVWDDSSGRAHWSRRPAGQPFFAVFNSTKSHESQIRTRPHQQILSPAQVRVPAYHPDTPEVRQDWAQYYDQVSAADADAGKRLQELAEAGLAEETIVFYYGDHGSGMPRSKRWPCNSGLHVPLIVYFPEKWRGLAPREYQAGGRSSRLIQFVDLAPTVLSLAGIEPLPWMQGRAFAGPFQADPSQYLHGARGRMDERLDQVRSVTDGRYVYLRNYYPHVSPAQHVDYQFQTPTTRVWHQHFREGKTTEAQARFWRAPKDPEELYDLQADPDEVRNLVGSPEHEPALRRLREAQREQVLRIRDVCLLPEGEMHSRAAGSTPYELARDEARYPLTRILAAAETASLLQPDALPRLRAYLADSDSAVRYWGALGILMRGAAVWPAAAEDMRTALRDASPHVRIVAAEAFVRFGNDADRPAALTALSELAPPAKSDVFVSMAALNAIEAIGDQGASLRPLVRGMNPAGPSPHARYESYVPRLIANITQAAP